MENITRELEAKKLFIKNKSNTFMVAYNYINKKNTQIIKCVKVFNSYKLELANFNNFKLENVSEFESKDEHCIIENVLSFIKNV